MLGVDPARCLVFEDSLAGALAARAAGMKCYVVPSLTPPPGELVTVATRIFGSWDEVTEAEITSPANGFSATR
jgi:beta-phosphoglucomutase-like phosphatase (HAD superfamily)